MEVCLSGREQGADQRERRVTERAVAGWSIGIVRIRMGNRHFELRECELAFALSVLSYL